jgi:hypothetical protein
MYGTDMNYRATWRSSGTIHSLRAGYADAANGTDTCVYAVASDGLEDTFYNTTSGTYYTGASVAFPTSGTVFQHPFEFKESVWHGMQGTEMWDMYPTVNPFYGSSVNAGWGWSGTAIIY